MDKKHNDDDLRLTKNNEYYSKLYDAKLNIFRMIAFTCLPIILIGILKQRYLLTGKIAIVLAMIIIIIASFFIIPAIVDMYNRDNMNYDEYKFPFNSNDKSNPFIDLSGTDTTGSIISYHDYNIASSAAECVGTECCTNLGLAYDGKNKKCIIQPSPPVKEAFLSGQSTQDSGSIFNSKVADKSLIAIDMSGKYYSLS